MKKITSMLLLTLAAALIFTAAACGALFDYDKDQADKRTREVIDVLKTGDYEAIVGLFREDLQALTTAADFKTAWDPYLADAGAFVEIKGISTAGQTEKSGEEFIISAVQCEYENATRTYTIVFDTDFNVAGLYLK